jgi:class 3 adenylate cyclase
MAQRDPGRGGRRGLAREIFDAWAQRDPGPPPMTPDRRTHERRKRVLQVLLLVWLLINGAVIAIWALEPIRPAAAGFWPAWIIGITALPLVLAGLYVFARRPIKEIPPPMPRAGGRVVTTVLFTDIVGSTERAREVGDRRWRDLLDRHDAMAGTIVRRHGGRVVKTTGDGILATFDAPGRAVQAAVALREEVRGLPADIRAGIHTGEVEERRGDVGGIGVHIAARVMAVAEPGQILVSRTVRDLATGSDLTLTPRGSTELRGLEGEWEVFSVDEP